VGLLACSGMLNGSFGEGESRHIAHWRSMKYVDEFHEEGEQEGETVICKRERFSHELTLAFADGRILELREAKQDVGGNKKQQVAVARLRIGGTPESRGCLASARVLAERFSYLLVS
jgi:hypothetical protein